jgi:Rieske 2Fe-2S family protein
MGELQAALPREYYLPGPAWEEEVRRVWRRSWVCVGRLGELGLISPRRLAVVEVAGESLLLTTDDAGTLHAHANVCRHRGAQLCPHLPGSPPAPTEAAALRCGYHSWTYRMDGTLLRAPHTERVDNLDPGSFGLHPVSVGSWGGFAFVRLAADGPSLRAELGGVPERTERYPLADLISAHRASYQVAANWKVIAENYNECYHCGPVHPELTRLVPSFGDGGAGPDGAGLDWAAGIPHREGAWTFSFSGGSPRRPFPDLDERELVRHKGELVYPNLLLSLSAEHAAAFVLQPLAADRTLVTFDVLVAADQLAASIEDCAGFWDLVNRQDWAICESVQRGMSSSFYTQGWYAPMEDDSLDIRRWLLPRLHDRGGLNDRGDLDGRGGRGDRGGQGGSARRVVGGRGRPAGASGWDGSR